MIKLKKLLSLTIGALLMISCASNKNISEASEKWVLKFEKGGCVEVCNAYTISIKSDGKYNYTGKYKVKHLGSKMGVLKPKELARLNDLLSIVKWEDVGSSFGLNANNSQLKVLQYSTKEIKKKTSYYSAEPQSIKDLEHYLDIIVNKDEI